MTPTWMALSLMLAAAPSVWAQSIEPRLYLPAPVRLNLLVSSLGRSNGDVVVDGAVPITNVQATMHNATFVFARTFGLAGRASQVQFIVPYAWGTVRGVVAGQDTSRDLSGLADPQLRVAMNLVGGPARTRAQMAGVRHGTMVGASFSVSPPLGAFDNTKRINVGSHRWSFKPELGLIQPLGGGWALESQAGVWLFGRNSDYLDTLTVSQDPLWAVQGHVIRLLGRRGWIALDGVLVSGGTTSVNDVELNNFQRSTRIGVTAAWSLGRGHGLRAAASSGVSTRFGGDFDSFSLGYQYSWGR